MRDAKLFHRKPVASACWPARCFCLIGGTAQPANQQLRAMQSQIKEEQQQTSSSASRELAKLNTQLKADEQAISAAAAKLDQTRLQLRQNQQKLASPAAGQAGAGATGKHQKQLLAKQAESAFQAGNHDYLKLLLNQQDPAKLSRALDYFDYLNKARIEAIEPCAPPATSWPKPAGDQRDRDQAADPARRTAGTSPEPAGQPAEPRQRCATSCSNRCKTTS